MKAVGPWMLADFRVEQRVWLVLLVCGFLAIGLAILL